jgi:hypothetical protein
MEKGVSAFVLKYRVIHSETDHPVKEKNIRIRDTRQGRTPASSCNRFQPDYIINNPLELLPLID